MNWMISAPIALAKKDACPFFFYHPLAALASVWEAVREEVFSSTSTRTIVGIDRETDESG
jgi:hypothetical protein